MNKYKWVNNRANGLCISGELIKVSIHKYIGMENCLFLSCLALNISQLDLHTTDIEIAKSNALILIKEKVKAMTEDLDKLSENW